MVIMYADKVTRSMQQSIDETNRRRIIQASYNQKHKITPVSIQKDITSIFDFGNKKDHTDQGQVAESLLEYGSLDDIDAVIKTLGKQMDEAARDLEFEKAADLRDQIRALQKLVVM